MASLTFDANTVAPATSREVLPAGDYRVMIESSDLKTTKKGDGKYLEFVFVVVDGPHKDRKLWERMTFENPSEKAVQIGRAQLSALCRAVGVMTPKDTSELHNRPLTVTVGHEKRADNGELSAIVKKFHAVTGNVGGAVVEGTSKPAPAAAPWAK